MEINENNIKIVRIALEQKLTEIAETYGLRLNLGVITYDRFNQSFSGKLTAFPLKPFLPSELEIGNVFKQKSTTYTVLSIDHKERFVSSLTNRNKRYKITFDQLSKMQKIPNTPWKPRVSELIPTAKELPKILAPKNNTNYVIQKTDAKDIEVI